MTHTQIQRKIGITTIAITLLLATSGMIGQTPNANALTHSSNVAYVFDFGTGISDTSGPGAGSSILVNAVNGVAISSGGTYTTSSGNAATISDVPVSTVDSGGLGAISGFDTVILYEVCDIASHPNLITALNTYLANGDGKVMIFDGDRCATGEGGVPDYSTFLFPFTSSNPGPVGASGSITFVESESSPATLTSGISTGPVTTTDAVGDSNTFTSNAGGWCAALDGTNALGTNSIQVGYVRTANGGLAIYDGQDTWFTFGPNAFDKQVFDNMLDQPFNPDSLPCGVPVTGIKLDPLTATNPAGTSHTVTATVSNSTGGPVSGVTVTFTVQSGPNAGVTGTAVSDASGHATFTYSDTGGVGMDTIVAVFHDSTGGTHTSNTVEKTWVAPPRATTVVTTSSQTGNVIPGTSVSDSANVKGSGTTPLPDLTGSITYQICGPNTSASTSLNCVAAGTVAITTPNGGTFTAVSSAQSPTAPGSYCWTATYTPTGSVYSTSNSTTTTNECFNVLTPFTQGKMTGGGSVTDTSGTPNTKVTHGFELYCDVNKGPNNLEINWGAGNKFHLDSLTSAVCVNDPTISSTPPVAGFNTYVGTGTGIYNGVAGATAQWTFTDAGEPGTSDHAKMIITDSGGNIVLAVSGNLQHGNQQAHNH